MQCCECKVETDEIGIKIGNIVLCKCCLRDAYEMTNMGYDL